MVQSVKSLREHNFLLPGQDGTARAATKLDEAAAAEHVQFGGEGEHVDSTCNENEFAKLTGLLEKAKSAVENGVAKPSIRSQVLAKLKSASDLAIYEAGDKGRLKVGKKLKLSDVSKTNVVEGQRARKKVRFESTSKDSFPSLSSAATTTTSNTFPSLSSAARTKSSPPLPKKKGNAGYGKIAKGDVVSASPTIFDGDVPGSFSESFPERFFGIVEAVKANGLVTVRWENDDVNVVKLKDLKRERKKLTLASIIVLLVEGESVAFKAKDEETNPKNFFELFDGQPPSRRSGFL
jgi:hypothetical protein